MVHAHKYVVFYPSCLNGWFWWIVLFCLFIFAEAGEELKSKLSYINFTGLT